VVRRHRNAGGEVVEFQRQERSPLVMAKVVISAKKTPKMVRTVRTDKKRVDIFSMFFPSY
jgi:hypothetical protein